MRQRLSAMSDSDRPRWWCRESVNRPGVARVICAGRGAGRDRVAQHPQAHSWLNGPADGQTAESDRKRSPGVEASGNRKNKRAAAAGPLAVGRDRAGVLRSEVSRQREADSQPFGGAVRLAVPKGSNTRSSMSRLMPTPVSCTTATAAPSSNRTDMAISAPSGE